MKPYVRTYLEHFGYISKGYKPLSFDDIEQPSCEICSKPAVDIHHIDARGMGGSKVKDVIENLMALCRPCHNDYGDVSELIPKLQEIHNKFLDRAA